MSAPSPDLDYGGPLDGSPLRKGQIVILLAAVILAALDGYDALSMAFVAPAISREWHLGKDVLGLLLASGLAGMAFGSLVLSPIADAVGRRPVVLGSLAVMTAGSVMCAFCHSGRTLVVFRVLTGIGIGVMVAMTTLLAAEFANARRRSLAIAAVVTLGFPLGGVVGGLTASVLLRTSGWPWVFIIGGISGGLLLVFLAVILPESPAFLAAQRSAGALVRLNLALARLGHMGIAELPPVPDRRRFAYRALFARGIMSRTLRLAAIGALLSAAAYFVVNWLPQIVADAGYPPTTGSLVSAISGAAGLIGGVSLGALAGRFPAARLGAVAMLVMALSLVALGFVPPQLWLLIACAGAIGLFGPGAAGIFFGIVSISFPSEMRASGLGFVLGVGRIASAIAPALAGWLFARGFGRGEVSLAFAGGLVIAAALIASLGAVARNTRPSKTPVA